MEKDMKSREIVKAFSDNGMRIEIGAQFSAKGQVAQLINTSRKLQADALEEFAGYLIGAIEAGFVEWDKVTPEIMRSMLLDHASDIKAGREDNSAQARE
jgi:hypothetical protein